jgi:hypothetical protein
MTIMRGLIAGAAAGALAAVVPWLLLELLLLARRLGADTDPSSDGARLGSYFLASLVGTAAFVSFAIRPRIPVWQCLLPVALVAVAALGVGGLLEGQRYKSEPPFGQKPTDILLLTLPAVVTGVFLLARRTLRKSGSTT